MKLVDEFRHAPLLQRLLPQLKETATRRWVVMDVCGGQTHAFLRYGIEAAVKDSLELIHGPGCPVCVTPAEVIEAAIGLAERDHVILASFGDMLRVPGPRGSLMEARTRGADVRMVYSPLDAVQLAIRQSSRQIVLLAVGFETTAPATALAVLQAQRLRLANFSVLTHHVRVEPGMRAILQQPRCRVQGFLAAGHVCTVTGYATYESLLQDFHVPIVVTGFEPVDLLVGLISCVQLLESGQPALKNAYARSAQAEGNPKARQLMDEVFEIATLPWRGLGRIDNGGLVLRAEFSRFDARRRFQPTMQLAAEDAECRSGDVLSGHIKPPECPLFGSVCTPDRPRGAPMVSSEGACAAYFHYGRFIEVARD